MAWLVTPPLMADQDAQACANALQNICRVTFCFQDDGGKLGQLIRRSAMTAPRRNLVLAILLLAVWGVAMLYAFWWFEGRYLRSFSDQLALFDSASLQLPADMAGPGPIRIVHFWDPACPCNAGNQQHLADLIDRYASPDVTFHFTQKAGSQGELPITLKALQPLLGMTAAEHIPASPAVAIWDREGELAYFGPYSEGAVCSSSNSFIEPILEALIAGRRVRAGNGMAVGCFCSWRS